MNKQCAHTISTVWFSHAFSHHHFTSTSSSPHILCPFPSITRSRQLQRNPIPSSRSLTAISRQTGLFRGQQNTLCLHHSPHARLLALCPTHGCTPCASKPPCTSKPPRASKHHAPPNPTRLQTPHAIEHHAPPHLLYHQSHIHSPIMCCISVCFVFIV